MSAVDKARLRKLLGYWMEHNQEHSQEVRDWVGRARTSGEIEVAEEMLRAAEAMDKATVLFSRSLERLKEA